jgi:hypothetical protein
MMSLTSAADQGSNCPDLVNVTAKQIVVSHTGDITLVGPYFTDAVSGIEYPFAHEHYVHKGFFETTTYPAFDQNTSAAGICKFFGLGAPRNNYQDDPRSETISEYASVSDDGAFLGFRTKLTDRDYRLYIFNSVTCTNPSLQK